MRKHLISFAIIACVLAGLLMLSGCQKKDEEDIVTRGEWLMMLSESFDLDSSNNSNPYYTDIPARHTLFSVVQALGDWDIIAPFSGDSLDADKPVTRNEVAASAAIAAGFKPGQEFQMDAAVSFAEKYGILTLDGEENMSTEECEKVLQAAQQVYLDAPGEEKKIAVFSEDLVDLTLLPSDAMQADGDTLLLPSMFTGEINQDETEIKRITVISEGGNVDLEPGDTFVIKGTHGNLWGSAYKVTSITQDADGNAIIQTQLPELGDIYDDLEVHTTVSLAQGNIRWAEGVTAELIGNAHGLSATGSEYRIEMLSSTKNDAYVVPLSNTRSFEDTWRISLGTTPIKAAEGINNTITSVAAAYLLETSGFSYSGTPSLDDFSDSVKSWQEVLENDEPFSYGLDVSGTISIELEVTTDVEYHKLNILGHEIQTWPEEASLIVNPHISSDLTIEGKLEGQYTLGEIEIPIVSGLSVSGSLFLYMDFNGRLQVGVDMSSRQRVEWNISAGFRKDGAQRNTFSAEAKEAALDASFGAGVSLDLCALSIKIIGADLKIGGDAVCTGSVVGECEETKADGLTVRKYTEALHFYSDIYAPVITLEASGPEDLSDIFGLEKSWDIIGRDSARRTHLWDTERVFWSKTVAVDEDGNTVTQSGIADGGTYVTKLASPNVFAFDYPDGWSITSESVSDEAENVVLSSETGAKIYFSFMTYDYAYGQIALNFRVEADISKVDDAFFDPEKCENTVVNYSYDAGPFIVAKVTTLQEKYISYADGTETFYPGGSPYEYDYAVLPAERVGLDWRGYYDADSFGCGGIVQFRAGSASNLSHQEEQEVVDILASFRIGVSDPLLADMRNGDFSYFEGSYTVDDHVANEYSWYNRDIPDWTLYSNGESDGGWFLEEKSTGAKPIRVTLNEDGSYECVIYEDNYSQTGELLDYSIVKEKFTLYPPGVPDNFRIDSSSDINKIRVKVLSAYGGVGEFLYQKN